MGIGALVFPPSLAYQLPWAVGSIYAVSYYFTRHLPNRSDVVARVGTSVLDEALRTGQVLGVAYDEINLLVAFATAEPPVPKGVYFDCLVVNGWPQGPPGTITVYDINCNAVGILVRAPSGQQLSVDSTQYVLPPQTTSLISGIQRITYGYPLIDSLPRNQFPRGGTYTAIIQGVGLKNVTGFVASNPNVTGTVSSATDSAVTVQLSSTPVKENDTAHAPISSVPFTLSSPSGSIDSGSVTFEIVAGPAPEVTSFQVTGEVHQVVAGSSTTIQFSAEIRSSGNIQFSYVGAAGAAHALPGSEDPFDLVVNFSVTWTIPSNFSGTSVGVNVGAVDGAGQGGETGNDPLSPRSLSVPVVH